MVNNTESDLPAKRSARNGQHSFPQDLIIEFQVHESSYRQTSNISRTLVGNKIVVHSDVVKASPVGAAPTTSSFST